VYIGNLPFNMGDTQLRELFAQHGEVASANVVTDRSSGQSRGFGFVEMGDEEARKAMAALNEHEISGRKLTVSEARPRREQGGGGGGRNRY
jgi:RNA recognition motif-containing protein